MLIRPLSTQDHANWLSLWQDYVQFCQTTLSPQTTAHTWANILNPDVPVWGFGVGRGSGCVAWFIA